MTDHDDTLARVRRLQRANTRDFVLLVAIGVVSLLLGIW